MTKVHPLALSEDDLYAKACIVMEATTGNVLFAHEADTQLYPASTTKIMTLLLALERGGLDQEITIPRLRGGRAQGQFPGAGL